MTGSNAAPFLFLRDVEAGGCFEKFKRTKIEVVSDFRLRNFVESGSMQENALVCASIYSKVPL